MFSRQSNYSSIKKKILQIIGRKNTAYDETRMISRILEMENTLARDIMVPRIDVAAININNAHAELSQLVESNIYSRIPVYDNRIDNVIGILHIKELLEVVYASGKKKLKFEKNDIKKRLTDPLYVPEAKKIIELLREFQLKRSHIAIVVDEYGGFSGIITMEDVIEEIIGDIQDEFDVESESIKQIDENTWSIDARTTIEVFNEKIPVSIDDSEIETVGGFVAKLAGKIPKRNEEITYRNMVFKVSLKKRNSIMRVKLEIGIGSADSANGQGGG
ncbi:MAG: hypothetical protein A2096_08985 [Spirochaetes bacterium GWF1_41_5]|nr:MAG: hypothetical protein A2096_08985 [Spirochaetes bacterium GWF1_41_5]HBE01084.1 hypothetical protein [Spirochaetia bacterium]